MAQPSALVADISDRPHSVSPRSRIELAATRDDAEQMADYALIGLCVATGVGIWCGTQGTLSFAGGWAIAVLGIIVLAVLVPARILLHRLRTDAGAWTVRPSDATRAQSARPASGQWGDILAPSRRGTAVLVVLGISWAAGVALAALGAESVGLLIAAPGSAALSFAVLVCVGSVLAHLVASVVRPLVERAERRTT